MTHSIGGGTGSGLGSLLLEKLKEEYPDKISCSFSVNPSSSFNDVVLSPYNSMLANHYQIEFADAVMCLDNGALS